MGVGPEKATFSPITTASPSIHLVRTSPLKPHLGFLVRFPHTIITRLSFPSTSCRFPDSLSALKVAPWKDKERTDTITRLDSCLSICNHLKHGADQALNVWVICQCWSVQVRFNQEAEIPTTTKLRKWYCHGHWFPPHLFDVKDILPHNQGEALSTQAILGKILIKTIF